MLKIGQESLFDLVKIHEPIANHENNIGNNTILTFYDQIRNMRPYKNTKNPNNTWKNVFQLCIEALKQTKDLNICCWMLESITYEEALAGFAQGLNMIQRLLQIFPDCYPLDTEEKMNSLKWVDDNMSSWLGQEEIFPKIFFKNIYHDIYNNKINFDLLKKKIPQEVFMHDKIKNINYIQDIIHHMGIYSSCLQNTLIFLQKLENFYLNYQKQIDIFQEAQITAKENNQILLDVNSDISKTQIFEYLSQLIKQGLIIDKNDFFLFCIQQVLLLRHKDHKFLLKILKDNQLDNLFNLEK
jgi:hypothetical protein